MNRFLVLTISVLAAISFVTVAQASTIGQREALASARDYLSSGHFSRAGLIAQLDSPYGEGFSRADAIWGVDRTHTKWYRQAVGSARDSLKTGHFSRAALIQQLQSPYGEKFTHAQAVYGVNVAYR
jgi:cellobiose-specific phosphotransferase system component IIA